MPSPADLSDALGSARLGDEGGITVLYRWLNPSLLRYLRYHASSMAEDIASEVWLAVAETLSGFDGGPAELRALLFTIARRRVVDHHRRMSRRVPEVPLEEAGEPSTPVSAEELTLERLMTELAVEMLGRDLPPEQAEIVLLRVVGGLSVSEVAGILGKTDGAVRIAQLRALRRLSRKMDESGVTR